MNVTGQVISLILLIVIGGFFSFAEISLAAASKIRLSAMAEQGNAGAQRALRVKDNPGRYFSLIQIGNNMVAILGGIVGESVFSPYFAWAYSFVLSPQASATAGFITSFLLITLAFVIFADLFPKRLSMNHAEKNAAFCTAPMAFLGKVLSPFVWGLEIITNTLLKVLGVPLKPHSKITSDDILATVVAGADAGVIAPGEQALIENVFNLDHRPVSTAMTARESVIYLTLEDSDKDIRRKIDGTPHSNFLVCDGDIDHVVGFISSKDIVHRLLEGKPLTACAQEQLNPAQFVPDTLTLSEILDIFQRTRTDFAVVLNEYALVVGIVTLNDVMSTVMGELVLTPEESQIVQRDETSWLVDGSTPVIDLINTLDIDELPGSKNYETVAGFMMYMLRKIPKRTDSIACAGYVFEVIDVDANKVDQVLVTKKAKIEKS